MVTASPASKTVKQLHKELAKVPKSKALDKFDKAGLVALWRRTKGTHVGGSHKGAHCAKYSPRKPCLRKSPNKLGRKVCRAYPVSHCSAYSKGRKSPKKAIKSRKSPKKAIKSRKSPKKIHR